jgi:hypothetical protein
LKFECSLTAASLFVRSKSKERKRKRKEEGGVLAPKVFAIAPPVNVVHQSDKAQKCLCVHENESDNSKTEPEVWAREPFACSKVH